MADAIVVYDVNINTKNAENTIKMLGEQIAEIGTAITSAFQVGAIGSFASESIAAYESLAEAQNDMTAAVNEGGESFLGMAAAITGVLGFMLQLLLLEDIQKAQLVTTTGLIKAKTLAILESAKAKLQAAAASNLMNIGMAVAAVAVIALVQNADKLSTGMKVLTSILIGLVAVFAVVKLHAIITGIVINTAFATVLVIIMAVAVAVAAVMAIVSLFSSKSDLQKRAEADKKALQEMNGELDETRTKLEDLSEANKYAADELERLSKAGDTKNISAMKAQAEELNKTLGNGAVTINESTGAIMLYGQELQKGSDELDRLIALKEADNAVSELQGKINEANVEKAEAEAALEKERLGTLELTRAEKQALTEVIKESTAVIDENNAALTGALEIQEQERLAAAAAREEHAQNVVAAYEEAEQIKTLKEQELVTEEDYNNAMSVLRQDYLDGKITDDEEFKAKLLEYQEGIDAINQQERDAEAAHYQALQEERQGHFDTLMGINDNGLYNEDLTQEKMLESWQRNEEQMKAFEANKLAIKEAGLDNLLAFYEKEGVATGAAAQETAEDLKFITEQGYKDLESLTEEQGTRYLDLFNEASGTKYKSLNQLTDDELAKLPSIVDANLHAMNDQIESNYETAGEITGGGFNGAPEAAEESLAKVASNVEAMGEDIKLKSEAAAYGVSDSFTSAISEKEEDVKIAGVSIGKMFMEGLKTGLEDNKWKPINKAKYIADRIAKIIRDAWEVKSPSRVAMAIGGYFSEGLAVGIDNEQQKAVSSAKSLASGVVNVGENLMRASTITNNIAPQYSMAGAGVNIDYNMLAAAMANVNIKMDSATVGKLVEPSVSKAQANRLANRF